MFKVKVNTPREKTKPQVSLDDDDDSSEAPRFRFHKKEEKKREFIVSDQFGEMFCGYRHGLPYWSHSISLAKELTEQSHFEAIKKWRPDRILKQEFL
jgi:hypothetical protein